MKITAMTLFEYEGEESVLVTLDENSDDKVAVSLEEASKHSIGDEVEIVLAPKSVELAPAPKALPARALTRRKMRAK
jgi:hypothetical protein